MSSMFPVNTTALLILQQSRPLAKSSDGSVDASGASALVGAGSPLTQARAKISNAMFSVTSVDPTEMKVRLIERLGEEFGIKQSDYTSVASYGWDIKRAVDELKARPGSALAIAAIEKRLGLDRLGVSLDDLVDATIDPKSDGGKKLDAALAKQAGELAKGRGFAGSLHPDEIGIYGH